MSQQPTRFELDEQMRGEMKITRHVSNAELREEALGVKSTEERPLWAVAAFEWVKGEWKLTISYNHAETEHQARATYILARKWGMFQIIDVGRAVGFFVNDNQGALLSV